MKISRNHLAFMSVLAAGLLLAAATFVLPSAKTYGSETDQKNAALIQQYNIDALAGSQAASKPAPAGQNQPAASAPQAPAPPAAPLDNNTPGAAGSQAGVNNSAGLPSTGDGGYAPSTTTNMGLILIGLGVAMMGSGSLAWAVSRKRR